ncbi:MAG: TraM recognition domain-containing protein [Anaeromyxobacter sp.]
MTDFGELLRSPHPTLDLAEAYRSGAIVYIALPVARFPETAPLVAKLVISDLNSVAGMVQDGELERGFASVVIDEFAAFAMPLFIDLLNKGRSAGMAITISHQSMRGDLAAAERGFVEQIADNTNIKICLRQSADAEYVAGLSGTYKTVMRARFSSRWPSFIGTITPSRDTATDAASLGTTSPVRSAASKPLPLRLPSLAQLLGQPVEARLRRLHPAQHGEEVLTLLRREVRHHPSRLACGERSPAPLHHAAPQFHRADRPLAVLPGRVTRLRRMRTGPAAPEVGLLATHHPTVSDPLDQDHRNVHVEAGQLLGQCLALGGGEQHVHVPLERLQIAHRLCFPPSFQELLEAGPPSASPRP